MGKCYICKERLSKSNSSIEHIIPNALGGNLKSRDLICKSCNSRMGSEEDATLAEQLNFISSMLNIKRDRGRPQAIIVEKEDKSEKYRLLPGLKPERIKPKVTVKDVVNGGGKKEINIIARDKKQARSVLNGLKRKYNITDEHIEVLLNSFELREEYFKEYLTFDIELGGEKGLKATAKIALNFYVYSGGHIKWIEDFICKSTDKDCDILSRITFLYLDHDVVNLHEDEILHSILIIGDRGEKILYGYIELFNAYRILVLLNGSYEGPDVSFSYFFDVESRKKRKRKYKLRLSRAETIKYLDRNKKLHESNLENLLMEMNNLMEIILLRHNNRLIDKIIKDTFEEMGNKYPPEDNEYITSEMLDFLFNELSKKYTMYLVKTGRINI